MERDWETFYRNTKGKPPSGLLVRALEYVQKRDAALDLGSGALRDSRLLVQEHFLRVVGVDKEKPPQELLDSMDERFEFMQSDFENYAFPREAFDLVNAQYSLPFLPPETFGLVWQRMSESLVAGGIYAGQFFGVEDEWNVPGSGMTFHAEPQVRALLSGFEVVSFREQNAPGPLASGQSKHWHAFHVIARKL